MIWHPAEIGSAIGCVLALHGTVDYLVRRRKRRRDRSVDRYGEGDRPPGSGSQGPATPSGVMVVGSPQNTPMQRMVRCAARR